ncbi:hypothetical protein OG897_13545 [Streptomyces sp. NBC_00237]|uniref:hypothetical protein n=1 Tax=Streptomyces sp. NBC_00237 TaxID=2975687 RepID=UPI00225C251F|nr:hypothetical protein [Streptomyces sp. NBC_00237]MCX5202468.1 hypothetical protein [Streptomyces sp. NBC_00237]
MPTTSYGHELSPGDDTDINDTPVCCDDMEATDGVRGGRDYTCPECSSVVSISATGLVNDIVDA